MGTSIKKNTAKLMMQKLQSELDALFAEQQVLNGDSKGSPQGGLPKAWGGIKIPQLPGENRSPYWPPGGQQALNTIADNYNPGIWGGSFNNVNVTGNYPYYSPGEVTAFGNRNTIPKYLNPDTGGYTGPPEYGLNSTNPWWRNGSSTSPQITQPGQVPSSQNINVSGDYQWPLTPEQAGYGEGTYPAQSKAGTGISSLGTASRGIDPSLRYTAPEDTWQPTIAPTVDPGSKMTFSNPLDDPNSTKYNPAKRTEEIGKKYNSDGINWGKAGTFAGQMAPMLYNMFKGLQKPEKTTPNYNPYEDEIRSTMRDRRFNIEPILSGNRTAQAVSNRNISNVANSRGEMMGNFGASQNYRMAGDAAAYAQKNNMDNQYLAEQAQMDANLGGNRAQMDWGVQTANSQNRAATNSFLGQGFNDLGRFAQTQQLMGNQEMRDAQLLGLYPDMFGVYNHMKGAQDIVNSAKTKNKKFK